jgi:hypothetical protein
MECLQNSKGRKGTKFIYLYWKIKDPTLNNEGNDIDSEFKQLKEYNKFKIKNESARKIKRIKKKIDINDEI